MTTISSSSSAAILSSLGVGSGIDINTMVSQLVAAEGKPSFDAIDAQKSSEQTRLSGLSYLKSSLSNFQASVQKLNSVGLFSTNQVATTDATILDATAGLGSVAGSHSITVTQLAKAQKLSATTEFSSLSDVVGTGTLTFTQGSSSFSVTLDSTNNSLTDVRDAINSASGNTGITASIMNVDSTVTPGTTVSKLVFSSSKTGAANGFTIDTGGDAALDRLNTATAANFNTTAAADAIISVDGETATRSSNQMTDVLPGVTLNLKKLGPADINLTLDQSTITSSINSFVSAFNSLNADIKSLGQFGGTGTTATGNGELLGDSTLRSISNQLRQNTTGVVSSATGSYNSLAMIGISIDKTGVMSLDTTKLTAALAANPSAVNDVFTSSNGVATRLNTKLNDILQTGGSLDSQQTSLNKQLQALTDRRAAVQSRLDDMQKTMQKQFVAMDTAVAQFKSTGTYLTKQFFSTNSTSA